MLKRVVGLAIVAAVTGCSVPQGTPMWAFYAAHGPVIGGGASRELCEYARQEAMRAAQGTPLTAADVGPCERVVVSRF